MPAYPIRIRVCDRWGYSHDAPVMQDPYTWKVYGPLTVHGTPYVPILIPPVLNPTLIAQLFENALASLDDLITSFS